MPDLVNVTQQQLGGAMKSAQRMREALKAHLDLLEGRMARASAEGRQIPSENNFFLYVADARGVIRIQQDAAFVVEAVLVAKASRLSTTSQATLNQALIEVSLVDANSGRDLTGGFHMPTSPPPGFLVVGGLNVLEESNFVDHLQLVPIAGAINDMCIPNVDNWKTQNLEYLLPRASVVRAAFNGYLAAAIAPTYTRPDVVLMGYKVF